ncbi:DUF4129 domain-containing protein [Arthrobacter sp. D1-29]
MSAEPPVLPGRDEARRWATEELAKPEYRGAEPGWLDSVWEAILDWLQSLDGSSSGADNTPVAPLIGVGIAVMIAVAIILARPRLNARSKAEKDMFDADTTVSASEYRSRAAAAAAAGDWSAAVVDSFRALVRTAEERNIVDARPGRTADEVAGELAVAFGAEAQRLAWAARTFDGIRYGKEAGEPGANAGMMALDSALQSLKPARTDASTDQTDPAVML